MNDIVLRDIDPKLQAHIQQVADAHGWELPRALQHLLELGLAAAGRHAAPDWNHAEAGVLAEAIAAMEQVPNDPGFALIGRAPGRGVNGSG